MKMNISDTVIADSSALISFVSPLDFNHKLAKKITKGLFKIRSRIIISGEIFAETMNVLGRKVPHENVLIIASKIMDIKSFLLTDSTNDIINSALTKFGKLPQSVSYTDCLVMAFADFYGTKDIFGFDESFKKNDYKRIGID